MKSKLKLAAALLALATISHPLATVHAQGTAFTYQGRLNNGSNPATGSYDFTFALYNNASGPTQIGGTLTNTAVAVTNGLFTVTLNFGGGVPFSGTAYYLQIGVTTNGGGSFSALSPRQPLTPTPYAIYAEGVDAAGINGTIQAGSVAGSYSNPVVFSNPGNSFSGAGTGLTNVNAVALGGLTRAGFWQLGGNAVAGGQFLGSTNNQPLELRVNNARAWRAESTDGSAVNVIGGFAGNAVTPGVVGAGIGAGGAGNYGGVAFSNIISGDFGWIGGGRGNQIAAGAFDTTIGGGLNNTVNAYRSTIAGGDNNSSLSAATWSVIGGGFKNTNTDVYATIGGGAGNTAGFAATVAGGYQNLASGTGSFIGGGGYDGNNVSPNIVSGNGSVIGGGVHNQIDSSTAVIGGGLYNQVSGVSAVIGGGYFNQVFATYATIGGGNNNTIQNNSLLATIAGGNGNTIQASCGSAAIAGGFGNTIQTNSGGCFIGGGGLNVIQTNVATSVIGGGNNNVIQSNAFSASIGGGYGNRAGSQYATIPGGYYNVASGNFSLAAGYFNTASGSAATALGYATTASGDYSTAMGATAQAVHQGTFVWADSQFSAFPSSIVDEFSIRAQNGVRIQSDKGVHLTAADRPIITRDWDVFAASAPSYKAGIGRWGLFMEPSVLTIGIPANDISGRYFQIAKYSTNGTATQLMRVDQSGNVIATGTVTANGVLLTSDRNAKENFTAVNSQAVLAKVAALPVSQWNYKTDSDGVQHIGPMAQDFQAAFQLSTDDKHISVVDEGGVALAAIQGLNQKLNDKEFEMKALKQQNVALAERLNELEALVKLITTKN